jgi:HEAT repeat protein
VLVAALAGEPAILDAKASDLLAQAVPVASAITTVMSRATFAQQWRVAHTFVRAGLGGELLDALGSPEAATRAAGAELCGALRLAEAVPWLSDLLDDADAAVRATAARALGRTGGRRAVDALMAAVNRFTPHRLAMDVARAASDIDLDGLLRQPTTPEAGVVVVLACGLRADALRFPRLAAIARDQRAAPQVRAAACRALGMIGDRAAAGVLRNLTIDPNTTVSGAASHALRRYQPGPPRRSL